MGADPVTLGIITVSLTAAAGATQAYGQYREGQALNSQAKYQAKVAENNALSAQYAAKDARDRGAIEARQQELRTRQVMASQRAGAASRGVLVDDGSALEQVVDTAGIGELDALLIRSNAEREAIGFENQGAEFRGEAGLRRAGGKDAVTGAMLGSTSTLLNTGANVSGKWYTYKTQGP